MAHNAFLTNFSFLSWMQKRDVKSWLLNCCYVPQSDWEIQNTFSMPIQWAASIEHMFIWQQSSYIMIHFIRYFEKQTYQNMNIKRSFFFENRMIQSCWWFYFYYIIIMSTLSYMWGKYDCYWTYRALLSVDNNRLHTKSHWLK